MVKGKGLEIFQTDPCQKLGPIWSEEKESKRV